MSILRVVLSIFALFILIVILAIGVVLYVIDPNQLKPVISKEVLKKTGYHLVIDSSLSWSFYPTFGVNVPHMLVKSSKPLANLSDVNIALKPSQLLHMNKKLSAKVRIGEITINNIHLQAARIDVHLKKDVLLLAPISAKAYEGLLSGTAQAQAFSTAPKWVANLQLQHFQVKPLIEALYDDKTKLKLAGTGDIQCQLTTSQGYLNGVAQLSVNQGNLSGLDVNYLIQTANAFVNQEAISAPTNMGQTDFDSLTAAVTIKNDVIETQNLLLTSKTFIANGQGSIDPDNQSILMQLKIKPQENLKAEWQVPIEIAGDLSHPKVRIKLNNEDKALVKEKIMEQIQENLPESTHRFIQNLLRH